MQKCYSMLDKCMCPYCIYNNCRKLHPSTRVVNKAAISFSANHWNYTRNNENTNSTWRLKLLNVWTNIFIGQGRPSQSQFWNKNNKWTFLKCSMLFVMTSWKRHRHTSLFIRLQALTIFPLMYYPIQPLCGLYTTMGFFHTTKFAITWKTKTVNINCISTL